tara:strand:+ start:440 stop:1126 length:687 start_codon:yes stop_codon:yes gene_type:complete
MVCELHTDGYLRFNIWRHSQIVRALYRDRARDVVNEMTCAAQAANLLEPKLSDGDAILDVGCGSGYFYHSLAKRFSDFDYFGIDATEELIEIGREVLPKFGLPAENLKVCRIEDFRGYADHVVCMNVLSNLDNFHKPLERLLLAARKTLILRESVSKSSSYNYVVDEFLDEKIPLRVHVNTYAEKDIVSFIKHFGFEVEVITDIRTGGGGEDVIGYPHFWTFIVARRI